MPCTRSTTPKIRLKLMIAGCASKALHSWDSSHLYLFLFCVTRCLFARQHREVILRRKNNKKKKHENDDRVGVVKIVEI